MLIPWSLKQFLYITLVTIAAFVLQQHYIYDQGYWFIWAALLASLITLGSTFVKRLVAILLTGFIATATTWLAGALVSLPELLIIYLFFLILFTMYLGAINSNFFFPAFIVSLFAIIASGLPLSADLNKARAVHIHLGFFLAALMQLIFYPFILKNKFEATILMYLYNLKQLNKEIFACLIQPEYADNVYLFERRLHFQKNIALESLLTMQAMAKKNQKKDVTSLVSTLAILYEIMLDYAQLRRRVTDPATFAVCKREFNEIDQGINAFFLGLIALWVGRKFDAMANKLSFKIKHLEDNYNHVLQVAAKEPLVFLLFIFSLKAFQEKLIEVYDATEIYKAISS